MRLSVAQLEAHAGADWRVTLAPHIRKEYENKRVNVSDELWREVMGPECLKPRKSTTHRLKIVAVPEDQWNDVAKEEARQRDEQDRGLGDTIKRACDATGIDKLAKVFTQLTGIDCKCADRQKWLNIMFPYKKGA